MSLPFDKRSLRATLLQQREKLSESDRSRLSAAAQSKLLDFAPFRAATTLALYSPIRNEMATELLLADLLQRGKRVCYPCVAGELLHFFQVNALSDLNPGCFGVCEPDRQAPEVDFAQLDLLLVPGVGFDSEGHRLGYGRGYYDRLLSAGGFGGLTVGFGYDFQLLDRLPAEEHDQRVNLLVTDKRIFSPL